MEYSYFIGIDVSKNELDLVLLQGKELICHQEIANTPTSVKAYVKGLYQRPGFDLSQAVFCLEHTGIYNNHLLAYLHQIKAPVCLQAASQIKSALGNIRGKSDKIDALRIAQYAYKNREELRLWQPKREVVQQLAHLAATRSRLLAAQKLLATPLQEQKGFVSKSMVQESKQVCAKTLAAIQADLAKANKAIEAIIQADEELKRLFGLVTSVSGVGKVTATQMLISTNEFRDIREAKKFAAYAGVAPYPHESGIYRGKARVSPMANKKMKTLLHLAALSAIQFNADLKVFYERKVNQQKKNKMSVINAVRNKLILRIFACVNQNRKYEKIYTKSLV